MTEPQTAHVELAAAVVAAAGFVAVGIWVLGIGQKKNAKTVTEGLSTNLRLQALAPSVHL